MSEVVVDTNIASYLMSPGPLRNHYARLLAERRLCISFVTPAEMRFGALKRNWGPERRRALEQALRGYVVLFPDDPTATLWAEIAQHERSAGRNQANGNDWWIAACARRYDLPLVTHNRKDFEHIPGLALFPHAPPATP